LGLFALLAVLAELLNPFTLSIANQVLLVGTAALGYNLMFGNAGQISLGSAAFLALGAFSAVAATFGLHLPFLASILVGGIAAAVLGVAIGIPSLRLSSHYLVFSTLALHFITLYVLSRLQKDPDGYSLPAASILGWQIGSDQHRWAIFGAATFVLTLWVVRNLLKGRPGRAWAAIREHPSAAAMMGIDVVFWRLTAFAFSAFLFGLVGGIDSFYLNHVSIDDFSLDQSITYVVVILVGGLGSIFGSVVGAITVVALPYVINLVLQSGLLGDSTNILSRHQFQLVGLIYGALVVAVILVEPGGIAAALRRLWSALRSNWRPTRPQFNFALPFLRPPAGRQEAGTMLDIAGLSVAYGAAQAAVSEVAFSVYPGTVVTILGPNGAGKTTTLRAIAGFPPGESARVRAERISLRGFDLRGMRPSRIARLGLSYVPERDKVFRGLSLRDNLRLRMRGGRAERARLRAGLFEVFPRLARLDLSREAGLLSGGERQMLAVAIALAGKPSVIILDEASLGLAPVAIIQLSEALRRLCKEQHVTILMAEQNIRMALDISDQIIVLINGRIIAQGPVAEWDEARLRAAYLGAAGET
jgi:branched-chain amino acid transport system permease protein